MAESSTIVSLPQMCDLALNTPEVGTVNFTVLHSLLQVMINQMGLNDTNIEFRGADSERIQNFMSCCQPKNALTLTEYSIGGTKIVKSKEEKGAKDENQREKTEQGRISKDLASNKDSSKSTIILVQSSKGGISGGHFTVAMDKEHFDRILNDMEKLKNRMKELEELPANSKLLEALMSEGNERTPVLDMFQILTLQKKMDAAEQGIEKLASMIEGMARGSVHEPPEAETETEADAEAAVGDKPVKQYRESTSLSKLEERVNKLEKAVKRGLGHAGRDTRPAGGEKSAGQPAESNFFSSGADPGKSEPVEHFDIETVDVSHIPVDQALELLKEQILSMKNQTNLLPQIVRQIEELEKVLSAGSEDQPVEVRVKLLETKFDELLEQIDSLDNGFSRQVANLQNHIGGLDKNMGEILEKVHLLPDEGKGDNITAELHGKLTVLTEDFVNVSETVQKLIEDNDNRQHSLEVLVEQVELLKTVKADREDLEDALADKADACQINRKVSFEQFDQACGDMTKSLEEALAKLTQQESLWNEALHNIQGEIGSKLDKNELNPLRDFINGKLKSLQEKFKTLSALKRENEAAGTKSKYLRNVNCISCDKDVVMRKEMDPTLYPPPNAVPPTRSMGPYLAYELDQLRKQQKCLPTSKNMNVFENALQSNRSAKSADHICNRYCGGSHTLTTPQQRVTRLGHFLEQWGPEISPVNDALVRGTDGRMYKARDDEALKQLAAERPPTPHNDNKPSIFINTATKKSTLTETSIILEQGKKSLVDHQRASKIITESIVKPAVDSLQ